MTEAEIMSYQRTLERKEAELESDLRKLDGIAIEREPDAMDDIRLSNERELAITNLDRETELLAQVRAARERIADGSYGICLVCSGEIRRARLGAVPWAPHCIRCQEAIDREEHAIGDLARMLGEAA